MAPSDANPRRGCNLVPPAGRFENLPPGPSCGTVKDFCGHGIGELFHCAPAVPHYARNKAIGRGLHSPPFQLTLSRFTYKIHPQMPLIAPETS
jgi:methionine aminopeptidase